MKVEKDNPNLCFFKDVKQGECFDYEGYLYLKTDALKTDGKYYYNVVSLETGEHCRFADDDTVLVRENAKVVIE